MDRQPINSSSIRSHGYDDASQTMEIEFSSGGVYRYRGITPDAYQAFLNAESAGKHFHSQIRPHYTGIKI